MADGKVFGTSKKPPLSGHKSTGVRVAYEATCECGWRGSFNYGGKFGSGGRAAAYSEWRSHIEKCRAAKDEGGVL